MTTFEKFAFQTPLYASVDVPDDLILRAILSGLRNVRVDGHCPVCSKVSTFSNNTSTLNLNVESVRERVRNELGYRSLSITCARDHSHEIKFWFLLLKKTVQKVGQYPSLADIANDEAAAYRSVLNKVDASELHKAIGLAAHGVGIGSFVYLRRIFERLIHTRFSDVKNAHGWRDEDFTNLRMNQKVEFLKGHIPQFLYENREVYAILSKGIHELSDAECLAFFEPLKLSLKIILEEDKKKKEEIALRTLAIDAIKGFRS